MCDLGRSRCLGISGEFALGLKDGSAQLLLSYGLMVLIGAGVFLGTALVLKHPELIQLKELLRRRRQRT